MEKRIAIPAAALACLLIAACSSAPKRPEAVYERRNEAAKLVALGAKAARGGAAAQAAGYYAEAYRLSLSVADDEGRVVALDGLAGIYAKGGVEAPASSAPEWGAPPATLGGCVELAASVAADSGRADLAGLAALSAAEAALATGAETDARRAESIAAGAEAALAKRLSDRARALRLLGRARKALGDGTGALAAFETSAGIDARDRRFAEYAASRYLAASVLSKNGDFIGAKTALLDALAADRKAENPSGIGADYRALGMVAEKAGDRAGAARYFEAAREVFAAARFRSDAEDAERRRAAVE